MIKKYKSHVHFNFMVVMGRLFHCCVSACSQLYILHHENRKQAMEGWFILKIGSILIGPVYYPNTLSVTQIYTELPYRI